MSPDLRRAAQRLLAGTCCAVVAATTLAVAEAAPTAKASRKTSALTLLNSLPVAAAKPGTFGEFGRWAKSKKRGCQTVADEVLVRDAVGSTPSHCHAGGLRWKDPLTGKTEKRSSPMTASPLVPTNEAWTSSGGRWDTRTRKAYLKDLAHDATLIATARRALRARADRDPATWLPARKKPRCAYAAEWVGVKYRWRLAVDPAEKAALVKVLTDCGKPRIAVPRRAKVTLLPAPTPRPTPTPSPATPVPLDPRMHNCESLRASGYGPYVRGVDPEYAWYRDDDADGNACEQSEDVAISSSRDHGPERWTRSTGPTLAATTASEPDPENPSVTLAGFTHFRISSGDSVVWHGVTDRSRFFGSATILVPTGTLANGSTYDLEIWPSLIDDPNQTAPPDAIAIAFGVDTEHPPTPTVRGHARSAVAVSHASDVAEICFSYGDYPHCYPAEPGREISWTARDYSSGPPLQLRVYAIDRAGNAGGWVLFDD